MLLEHGITSSGSHLLSLLVALPLLFGISLFLIPRGRDAMARTVALFGTLVTFIISMIILKDFDGTTANMQFTEVHSWIPEVGASFVLGVDGISIWLRVARLEIRRAVW